MISKSGKLLLPGDQDALNTLPIVLFCTPLSHTHKEIAFGCWETINCSLTESITLLTAFSKKRKKTSFTLLFKTYLLLWTCFYNCQHFDKLSYFVPFSPSWLFDYFPRIIGQYPTVLEFIIPPSCKVHILQMKMTICVQRLLLAF